MSNLRFTRVEMRTGPSACEVCGTVRASIKTENEQPRTFCPSCKEEREMIHIGTIVGPSARLGGTLRPKP